MTKEKKTAARLGPPPPRPGVNYVNLASDDQMEIEGFERSVVQTVITWTGIVLSVGLLRLFFFWRPDLFLRATHRECDLHRATSVLLTDNYRQSFAEVVRIESRDGYSSSSSVTGVRYTSQNSSSRTWLLRSQQQLDGMLRVFTNKKIKYYWLPTKARFEKLQGIDVNPYMPGSADYERCSSIDKESQGTPISFFHRCKGLTVDETERRRQVYGSNHILVKVTPLIRVFFKEVLSPFYIFQVFSCTLWYFDDYYVYATCIVVISAGSMTLTMYQIRKQERDLKSSIAPASVVTVVRAGGEAVEVMSDTLVPGDLIEIPRHGCLMQCDAVLLTGNCIVNESMLTGESVPVTKTQLPVSDDNDPTPFNPKSHGRHVLNCGTHVIQTRYYGQQKVTAVVLRTGFATAKGDLVRSIMFPKPVDFKFYYDTYYFVGVLAGIAGIGFVFTIILMSIQGEDAGHIAKRALDLITIAVPPALPAALGVGVLFAQRRLRQGKIFCISPRAINICGSLNCVAFDKTGTLTEDGMDMWGVLPVHDQIFEKRVEDASQLERGALLTAMSVCHSLTFIDNELSGDPLDLKMFQSTKWVLEEPGEDSSRFDQLMPTVVKPVNCVDGSGEVGILRQFPFQSSLQRMSVIAKPLQGKQFHLYCKGSPEKIMTLCKPETLPDDFHDVLLQYTKRGFRVIAVAWKPLEANLKFAKLQRITRDQLEHSLEFLGFLIMENRLKPETAPVIQQLSNANIRSVMITGDNLLTGLSVARDCHMISENDSVLLLTVHPPRDPDATADVEFLKAEHNPSLTSMSSKKDAAICLDAGRTHLAVTGRMWDLLRTYRPDLITRVAVMGTVFARMSPEQKAQLVEVLQELDYYVGMCGDGANDCGALKTAHAGVSLSEAEASIASPFTSKTPNIECIPRVIREGRCALTTSFGIFKFMACYSLTQFVTVILLYWVGANLTDWQFLFIDLILLTTLSVTFALTGPYENLAPKPPLVALASLGPITSLIVQTMLSIAFQTFMFFFIQWQPWFEAFVPNEEDDYWSYEDTALVSISSFQYITLAIIFSKGPPYRRTIFSNIAFMINLLIVILMTIWLVLQEPMNDYIRLTIFEIRWIPSWTFKGFIFCLGAANFFIAFILETYIIDGSVVRNFCTTLHRRMRKRQSNKRYKQLTMEMSLENWPTASENAVNMTRLESNIEQMSRERTENSLISGTVLNVPDNHVTTTHTAPVTFTEGDNAQDEQRPNGSADTPTSPTPLLQQITLEVQDVREKRARTLSETELLPTTAIESDVTHM